MLKFGLLYEIQGPGDPLDERQLYEQTIEQIVLADQLGFDYVWFVEHHFLTRFAYSSAPEVLMGALSRLTKHIRLGFGVTLLPYRFNHPIRVAERVAVLDLLSNGRIDLGTGRSSPYEQHAFGIDPRDTRELWEEAIEMIPCMWTQDPFEWHSKHFDVPPRSVIPKPLQQPHPPLWMAGTQPESFSIAARKGLGVLSMATGVPQRLTKHINNYRALIKDSQPVGVVPNNQWANFTLAFCDEDDAFARAMGARGIKDFFGANRPYTRDSATIYDQFVQDWGGEVPDHLKYHLAHRSAKETAETTGPDGQWQGRGGAFKVFQDFDENQMAETGIVVAGNPQTCIEAVRLHEQSGVDQMMLLVQEELFTHDQAMKSLRLLGEQVLPEFGGGIARRMNLSGAGQG
jgi:alkanesulfonate monooxygenase SsuD/methylene tetrahydromethanopterin reductase-like flavin-dependent oxidoreductase (luciferase family)